jgi:hypothetical protein
MLSASVLCALLAWAPVPRAQARFEAVAHDVVPTIPGLQILTIRDNMLSACYTLFVIAPAPPTGSQPQNEPASAQDAAVQRDRQLSALSLEFERGLPGGVPATLGSDPLKYAWEGQKVQSEYERVLRENDLVRIEERLVQIVAAPRLAVSGPVACHAS